MFRIVCDPSSGSIKLYLTEFVVVHCHRVTTQLQLINIIIIIIIIIMFVVCLIGVWQRNFWTSGVCVCVYGTTVSDLRTVHTHTTG